MVVRGALHIDISWKRYIGWLMAMSEQELEIWDLKLF